MGLAAVIFDLDGTLFDHPRSAVEGLRTWLGAFGRDVTDELTDAWFAAEARYYQSWLDGKISYAEQRRGRLRDFLPLLGLSVGSDAELDVLYAQGFLTAYQAGWCGYDDVAPALAALQLINLRTGVLTNGAVEQQNDKVRAIGLAHLLGPLLTSEELGYAKPDPRAFHAACRMLGVHPDQALYVKDNHVVDVLGARAAGLAAVHVQRTADGASDERSRIKTLNELVGFIQAEYKLDI